MAAIKQDMIQCKLKKCKLSCIFYKTFEMMYKNLKFPSFFYGNSVKLYSLGKSFPFGKLILFMWYCHHFTGDKKLELRYFGVM